MYNRIDSQGLWNNQLIVNRNDFLKLSGSIDTNLYYILSGSLKIFINHKDEEHIIRFGYQDNFIASLDSFITEKPSDFNIQAIKKTELNVISKSSFMSFIQQDIENRILWDQILGQLIVDQLEREKDILINSPMDRFQRVFKRSPQLFQEIPNKHIASYLRMTPETLSRLKKS